MYYNSVWEEDALNHIYEEGKSTEPKRYHRIKKNREWIWEVRANSKIDAREKFEKWNEQYKKTIENIPDFGNPGHLLHPKLEYLEVDIIENEEEMKKINENILEKKGIKMPTKEEIDKGVYPPSFVMDISGKEAQRYLEDIS